MAKEVYFILDMNLAHKIKGILWLKSLWFPARMYWTVQL